MSRRRKPFRERLREWHGRKPWRGRRLTDARLENLRARYAEKPEDDDDEDPEDGGDE